MAGAVGAGISLGYQLVFEKKELNMKTVAQATLDGIVMAVGASAATVGWQIVTNVETSVISGIMNEDDGMEIACQATVSGALAYFGGKGNDFAGIEAKWKFKVSSNAEVKDINIRTQLNEIAGNQFKRKTKRGIYNMTSSTVRGNGASRGVSKGYSGYMGPIIGEERRYNGKVTIYSHLYYGKDKSIVKRVYKIV